MAAKRKADGRVPVTMRALVQRINRALRADDEQLKKYRGGRWQSDLGDWYRLDFNRNRIMERHVDPEALGRKLGVLRDYERLVEDQ